MITSSACCPRPTRTSPPLAPLLLELLACVQEQLDRPAPALRVPIAAAAIGRPEADVLRMLSELRDLQCLECVEEAPYFRVTPLGRAVLARR